MSAKPKEWCAHCRLIRIIDGMMTQVYHDSYCPCGEYEDEKQEKAELWMKWVDSELRARSPKP